MEEDIIYDLESASHAEDAEEQSAHEETEISECFENFESPEVSEDSDSHDDEEESQAAPARKEIERMVEEVGAETLLDIIRDNRNAAIRQIIREVEASKRHYLPSGTSVATRECGSIFDLAELA